MAKKKNAPMHPKLKELLSFSQFLPLIFWWYTLQFQDSIEAAFLWAGGVALVATAVLYFLKIKMNKFLLAANCFFMGGALLFVVNIDWLEQLYAFHGNVVYFAWLFIVGLISMFISKEGFIDLEGEKDKTKILRTSFYLLCGVVVAGVVGYKFAGDMISGLLLPILGLVLFRRLLK